MVATVYGFTTKVSALQFEWAWQNPKKSLKTRDKIIGTAGIGSGALLNDKLKILWEMCCLPPWSNQPLIVNIFPQYKETLDKVFVQLKTVKFY